MCALSMAGPGPSGSLVSGRAVAVRAAIDLAGLAPSDVRAEVVIGRVDSNGHLEETEVIVLPFVEQQGAGRGVCQRYHSGTHRTAGLRLAREPESLRRSPDPALCQLDEMEFAGVAGCGRGVQSMSVRGTYVFEAEAGSDLLFAEPSESPSSPSGNPTTQLLPRGLSRGLVGAIGILMTGAKSSDRS